jgi:uncharacterized membrane protein (DUF2068 family)
VPVNVFPIPNSMEILKPSSPETARKAPELSRKIPGLRIIAIIKIAKGFLISGIALGIFSSINRDLGQMIRTLTFHLRIDPENHFIRILLERVTTIQPHTLRTFGLISVLYAGELYIEGIGLWLNQSWAEYMVVVATGFFVPEEAYSCFKHFDWERVGLLVVNVAVLVYVTRVIWRKKKAAKALAQ